MNIRFFNKIFSIILLSLCQPVFAQSISDSQVQELLVKNPTIFKNLSNPFVAGRYHSLSAEKQSIPDVLKITAMTDSQEIMGVRHKELPIEGVQFHPESILTPDGQKIIQNFLKIDVHD